MRHNNAVVLHYLQKLLNKLCDIYLSHIQTAVFIYDYFDILVQLCPVRLTLKVTNCKHRILYHADIVHGDAVNSIAQFLFVMLGKPPHHAHINPDNFAIPYPYIARMRVRMEEAILYHLPDIVVNQLAAYLLKIIAIL